MYRDFRDGIRAPSGAACLCRGFRLIGRPDLRRYTAIPLIINALLFSIAIGYGSTRFAAFYQGPVAVVL